MPRERQALTLLIDGASDKEIARAMGVAIPTAKQYVAGAIKVLGLKNRVQAAVWAARNLVEA